MQAVNSGTSTTAAIDDYDDICSLVQLYIDGIANGDVNKLKEVFHQDARIFGEFMGKRYNVPIAELLAGKVAGPLSECVPVDTSKYRGRITSVNQAGDVAFAAVAEDGFWGTVSFVNYFLLTRIEGRWKITCKAFAHTSGEPPRP